MSRKEKVMHFVILSVIVVITIYIQENFFLESSRIIGRGERRFLLIPFVAVYFLIYYTLKKFIDRKKK